MKFIYKIVFLSAFLFTISLTLDNEAAAECTTVSGVITQASANDGCDTEPSSYGIEAYKLYLCTAAPTAPTTSTVTDLSDCVMVFENSEGSDVSLSREGSVNLGGTQTLPPPGGYTHAVIQINNTFDLTAKKEFAVAYDGQVSGNGVFCVTVDGEGRRASTEGVSQSSICGDSTLTAGTHTVIMTTFNDPTFSATTLNNNVGGTGGNLTAYLIDTNEFLAENDADVNNILGVFEFASATNITASTSNVDVSFNIREGLFVEGIDGRIVFSTGPVQVIITNN